MEQVRSADGTNIAVDRTGHGPALVLILGAFCDRSTSKPLAELLTSSYTVFEYDRRGRGDSGDTLPYSTAREIEDLEAVVAATGSSPFVYGHSSGGALALEAAAHGIDFRKIAVYEPPYSGDDAPGPEFAAGLDELAASGRQDEAAERFLTLVGAPPEAIGYMKTDPDWPRMARLTHTLSRDLGLGNGGSVPVERLSRVRAETLAMAGGASYEWARAGTRTIAKAVPHAKALVVEGQQHAPAHEVLAPILLDFFT